MREEARQRGGESGLCAFCRTPAATSDEEENERIKKMAESGNAEAIYNIGNYHFEGAFGFPLDLAKANELYLRAGELGCAEAYFNLGNSYNFGRGVEVDEKKAKHYYELAAMNGDVAARYNLGCLEERAGGYDRAFKHFILSARDGDKDSMNVVKEGFMKRYVAKEEYANTLRAFQKI